MIIWKCCVVAQTFRIRFVVHGCLNSYRRASPSHVINTATRSAFGCERHKRIHNHCVVYCQSSMIRPLHLRHECGGSVARRRAVRAFVRGTAWRVGATVRLVTRRAFLREFLRQSFFAPLCASFGAACCSRCFPSFFRYKAFFFSIIVIKIYKKNSWKLNIIKTYINYTCNFFQLYWYKKFKKRYNENFFFLKK